MVGGPAASAGTACAIVLIPMQSLFFECAQGNNNVDMGMHVSEMERGERAAARSGGVPESKWKVDADDRTAFVDGHGLS